MKIIEHLAFMFARQEEDVTTMHMERKQLIKDAL
jgi:hypothetical protein